MSDFSFVKVDNRSQITSTSKKRLYYEKDTNMLLILFDQFEPFPGGVEIPSENWELLIEKIKNINILHGEYIEKRLYAEEETHHIWADFGSDELTRYGASKVITLPPIPFDLWELLVEEVPFISSFNIIMKEYKKRHLYANRKNHSLYMDFDQNDLVRYGSLKYIEQKIVGGSFISVIDIQSMPIIIYNKVPTTLSPTVYPTYANNNSISISILNTDIDPEDYTFDNNIIDINGDSIVNKTIVFRVTVTNGRSPTEDFIKDFSYTINTPSIANTNLKEYQDTWGTMKNKMFKFPTNIDLTTLKLSWLNPNTSYSLFTFTSMSVPNTGYTGGAAMYITTNDNRCISTIKISKFGDNGANYTGTSFGTLYENGTWNIIAPGTVPGEYYFCKNNTFTNTSTDRRGSLRPDNYVINYGAPQWMPELDMFFSSYFPLTIVNQ